MDRAIVVGDKKPLLDLRRNVFQPLSRAISSILIIPELCLKFVYDAEHPRGALMLAAQNTEGEETIVDSPSTPYDVGYWQRRATETRALAQGMTDVHTKILSLGVAEIYEQIAKAYEKRVKRKDALSRPE